MCLWWHQFECQFLPHWNEAASVGGEDGQGAALAQTPHLLFCRIFLFSYLTSTHWRYALGQEASKMTFASFTGEQEQTKNVHLTVISQRKL